MKKRPEFTIRETSVIYTPNERLRQLLDEYELNESEIKTINFEIERRAKAAAEKLEKADSLNRNAKLIEALKAETVSLKKQYVEMTGEWAKNDYARIEKIVEEYRHTRKDAFIEKYNSDFYYETQKKYHGIYSRILRDGIEKHVEKQKELAESHYENSIIKLAYRVEKKGLFQDRLKVSTAHVGVNINTTLTDGEKTVKAFTIIASGLVQRPHYRYLVK